MLNISIGFGNWKLNVLVFGIVAAGYIWYKRTTITEEVGGLEEVAKNWILLTDPKCPFCVKQMEVLGPSKNLFKILDVKKDEKLIKKLKFPTDKGVPCWVNTKTKKFQVGLMELADIKRL